MLRQLLALLHLLVLPVFAQASSTLEQFHEAIESFEWERWGVDFSSRM